MEDVATTLAKLRQEKLAAEKRVEHVTYLMRFLACVAATLATVALVAHVLAAAVGVDELGWMLTGAAMRLLVLGFVAGGLLLVVTLAVLCAELCQGADRNLQARRAGEADAKARAAELFHMELLPVLQAMSVSSRVGGTPPSSPSAAAPVSAPPRLLDAADATWPSMPFRSHPAPPGLGRALSTPAPVAATATMTSPALEERGMSRRGGRGATPPPPPAMYRSHLDPRRATGGHGHGLERHTTQGEPGAVGGVGSVESVEGDQEPEQEQEQEQEQHDASSWDGCSGATHETLDSPGRSAAADGDASPSFASTGVSRDRRPSGGNVQGSLEEAQWRRTTATQRLAEEGRGMRVGRVQPPSAAPPRQWQQAIAGASDPSLRVTPHAGNHTGYARDSGASEWSEVPDTRAYSHATPHTAPAWPQNVDDPEVVAALAWYRARRVSREATTMFLPQWPAGSPPPRPQAVLQKLVHPSPGSSGSRRKLEKAGLQTLTDLVMQRQAQRRQASPP